MSREPTAPLPTEGPRLQNRAEEALLRQNRVLERIIAGAGLRDLLEDIVALVEDQLASSHCSILLLDEDGLRLRSGAAPHLPDAYNAAIDGAPIGPSVGSCGTAAYRGETVIVADIASDPLWVDYRDVALRHGLRSCWSVPILARQDDRNTNRKQRVLGTFALYRSEPATPSARDLEVVGQAAHLAGVAIQRERDERALRESEERFRRLVEVLPVAILINSDDRIVYCNPACVRLFGASRPEDLLGRSPFDFIHPDDRDTVRARIAVFEQGIRPPGSMERKLMRLDGKPVPTVVVASKITERGSPAILVAMLDMTDQRRLEERLVQAQKMEAVGRLAGGVAHDFNNLLTIINGFSEILLAKLPEDDARREPASAIRDAGERAAGLTQQLLAFSRKAIIEPKVIDLNEVVGSISKMLSRLIGEGIMLTTRLYPQLYRVKVDRGQMEQALVNLALNGRDAMPDGGRLTIQTMNTSLQAEDAASRPERRPGNYVELSVSDTGAGMSDEVKARVFEPFFTTKGLGKGTGLGLATVHGIVEQSGGYVVIDSAPGRGTTFRIFLPATTEVPAPAVAPPARPLARRQETILLAEDEDGVRDLARRALEMHGFSVLEARTGAEALRVARAHPGPLDLLVTDVVMPDTGGRALADSVRAVRPAIKVLYMSGYTDDEVVRHGVEAATDTFLQKPFTLGSLARKVEEVLDGPSSAG